MQARNPLMRTLNQNPQQLEFRELSNIVRNEIQKGNISEDAKLIFRKPEQGYWYLGLKTHCYPMSISQDSIFKFIMGYDYVLLTNLYRTDQTHLLPVLRDSIKYFQLKVQGKFYALFEVQKQTIPVPKDF